MFALTLVSTHLDMAFNVAKLFLFNLPDAVVESVERGPHVQEIWSLVVGRVKSMTYKIDNCRFVAWCLALIVQARTGVLSVTTVRIM